MSANNTIQKILLFANVFICGCFSPEISVTDDPSEEVVVTSDSAVSGDEVSSSDDSESDDSDANVPAVEPDLIAPALLAVQVQTGLAVAVTFSEEMDASALVTSNYILSGSGSGTLSVNPDTVILMSASSYLLSWNVGEMQNSGDITITVIDVADLAGNVVLTDPLQSSAIHVAGAIGVAPSVDAVTVQSGTAIDITFSELMGSGVTDTENYVLSGSGRGSVAVNPYSVVLVSGATYRLTWDIGEMMDGGDLSLGISGVADLAGNQASLVGDAPAAAIGFAPTVAEVEVFSGSQVDVTFSEQMDDGALLASHYVLSGSGAGTLDSNPEGVEFLSGATYRLSWSSGEMFLGGDITITASGVLDLAGNALDTPDSDTHAGGALGAVPSVTNVSVVDGTHIDVTFSEVMSEAGLTTAENYVLSGTGQGTLGANPDLIAVVSGNTYRLTWNAGEMKNGADIGIAVTGVQDVAGNGIGGSNSAIDAGGAAGIAPTVGSVSVVDSTHVDVTFSEVMSEAGLTTAENYALSGTGQGTLGANPDLIAVVSGNTYRLTWSSGDMTDGGDISVTVTGVADLAGNAIGSPNSGTDAAGAVGVAPLVASVDVQNGWAVYVAFSDVMGSGVTTAANYTIGESAGQGTLTDNPDSVALVSGSTYVLSWNEGEMKNGADISINVIGVSDAADNAIGGSNFATDAGGGIGISPAVSSVAVVDGTHVDVTFSEAMGSSGLTTAASYTLSGTGKGSLADNPDSVANSSGNTYRLTWNSGEMKNGGDMTVTAVSSLSDLAGNALGSPDNRMHTGGAIGVAPAVSSVTVQDYQTVRIVFDEAMNATSATTAANYTVSGSGQGTLAANPDSVTAVSSTAYDLIWNTNHMTDGGDVTVTAGSGVTDVAGNPIGASNIDTDIGGGGSAPTISTISNQSTTEGTATSAIAITIGDFETAAADLTMNGSSDTTSLVANGNIVFGGAGANRTVTITPTTGQTGSAVITASVSDAAYTTNTTFTLTVISYCDSLAENSVQRSNNSPFANSGDAGIDGTTGKEYTICTATQMNVIGANNATYKAKSFILKNDIDLTGVTWNRIGDDIDLYSGTFDGNNKTISNLTINTASSVRALFGYTQNATLKNLYLNNFNTIVGSDSGGLVADARGATVIRRVVLQNSSITTTTSNVGGLVGIARNTTSVEECAVLGGTVTSTDGGGSVGGLVGNAQSTGSIVRSYSTANIQGHTYVGGLVGSASGPVIDCYATGAVQRPSGTDRKDYRGGLIGAQGAATGKITKSYFSGTVTGASGDYQIGGLYGGWGANPPAAVINYSFSAATLLEGLASSTGKGFGGSTNAVCFVGDYFYSGVTCTNGCTADNGRAGLTGVADRTSFYDKDNQPMTNGTNDWDFTNVWRETDADSDGTPDGFPVLRWANP